MIPKTTENEPNRTKRRGLPMSKMGPHDIGEAQRKNEVKVPIQEMDEFDVVGSIVPL